MNYSNHITKSAKELSKRAEVDTLFKNWSVYSGMIYVQCEASGSWRGGGRYCCVSQPLSVFPGLSESISPPVSIGWKEFGRGRL